MKAFFFVLILMVPLAISAPLKKKRTVRKRPKIMAVKPPPAPVDVTPQPISSPYFLNASFGASRWEGLGFFSGLGLGVFPAAGNRLGWGLEGQLLLVPSGALFSILGGAWYFFSHPYFSQKLVTLGLLLGPGFPSGGLPISRTVAVGFFEIAGNQRLSNYGWLKLWTRGGLLEGKAIAQLGLSLLFQLN
ncbi:MAG: hypothetical protein ACKN9V_09575 [Pseudomonadota bacterium]